MARDDSRSRSTDRRFYGVVSALVVEVEDEAREGRVKLNFPWFDGGTSTSDWCRVAQPYAGPGHGAFFVPEIGSEVLVSFEHGDMRKPFVVGSLYNGKDKPATWRASDKDQKIFRTRVGHQLTLDDTKGEQGVRIETHGGHVVELSDDGKKIKITHSGGTTYEMTDTEVIVECTTMTVKGDLVVQSKAGRRTTISGNEITGS